MVDWSKKTVAKRLPKFGEGLCWICKKRVHYDDYKRYQTDIVYGPEANKMRYVHRRCWWKVVTDFVKAREKKEGKHV